MHECENCSYCVITMFESEGKDILMYFCKRFNLKCDLMYTGCDLLDRKR